MISDDILNSIESDLKEIAHRENRVLSVIERFPSVLDELHSETKRSRNLVVRLARLIGRHRADGINLLVGESVLPPNLIKEMQHMRQLERVSR